jgi:hypothetical protein
MLVAIDGVGFSQLEHVIRVAVICRDQREPTEFIDRM